MEMTSNVFLRALCISIVFSSCAPSPSHSAIASSQSSPSKLPSSTTVAPRSSPKSQQVRCIESGRFYRDPDVNVLPPLISTDDNEQTAAEEDLKHPLVDIWSRAECAKYFLCLEEEVFAFQCTGSLAFDVEKQICTGAASVENCDLITDNDEDIIEEPEQQSSQSQSHPTTQNRPLQSIKDKHSSAKKPIEQDNYDPSDELSQISDQQSTTTTSTTTSAGVGCERSQRPCLDGSMCFPTGYFCDGSEDCPDGSDEGMCDVIDDPNAALHCNVTACRLPDCFCSRDGTNVPGNLDSRRVPQMVTLTFDGAVTAENFRLYMDTVFTPGDGERTNPNGCPLIGTFFVSHQGNDYHRTQRLWNAGHEIAIHSITHRGPPDWWSHSATVEDWFDEMIGQANILHRFAKIPMQDIRGLRVPYLQIGWHRQFLMMKEFGFGYDSSIIAPAAYSEIPLWPYTLDYRMPHDCKDSKQHCPTRSFPGIWEMVINPLVGKDYTCSIVDDCPSSLTGDEVYHLLHYNFKRHYHTNRAPFGLYFHAKWFKKVEYLNAFMRFLDDLIQYPDVWFVSKAQVIDWLRKPTSLDRIESFEPWTCDHVRQTAEDKACAVPNVCKLRTDPNADLDKSEMTMNTCATCPSKYPWLRNEFGKN